MQTFKRFIFFLLLIWAVDFCTGQVLKKLYFSQKSNQYFRTTYTLEQVNKNIIILGSSRANHHYSDTVFEKGLNRTYYNAGVDGEFLTYSYAMFHGITERYKPDLVILDITAHALSDIESNSTNIASLRPYYSKDIFYRKLAYGFSFFEPIKNVSWIFPYNNKVFSIFSGNVKANPADTIGFFPLHGIIDTTMIKRGDNGLIKNNPRLENMFTEFMENAKRNNINIYVVISPLFYKPESAAESVKKITAITTHFAIPFFDYSSDTAFLRKRELFYDNVHLNETGSLIFSRLLLERLKAKNLIRRDY